MPIKKPTVSKKREPLTLNRANERNTHYELINTIKQHNQNNEPINFKKLCQLTDFHIVAQFIREAEGWGMIDSRYGEINGDRMGRVLTVTSVGEVFIKYCEQTSKTTKIHSRELKFIEKTRCGTTKKVPKPILDPKRESAHKRVPSNIRNAGAKNITTQHIRISSPLNPIPIPKQANFINCARPPQFLSVDYSGEVVVHHKISRELLLLPE